jgi:hypothetical protein
MRSTFVQNESASVDARMCSRSFWRMHRHIVRILPAINPCGECLTYRIRSAGSVGVGDVRWWLDLLAWFRRTSIGWHGRIGGRIRLGLYPRMGRSPGSLIHWNSPRGAVQPGASQEEKSDEQAVGCNRR